MEPYIITATVENDPDFCASINTDLQAATIEETFLFTVCNFCNYGRIKLKVTAADALGNTLTFIAANGSPAGTSHVEIIDVANPGANPSHVQVNLEQHFKAIYTELNYNLAYATGLQVPPSTLIVTTYEVEYEIHAYSNLWQVSGETIEETPLCLDDPINMRLGFDEDCGVTVSPNPASQSLRITSDVAIQGELIVTDINGRQVSGLEQKMSISADQQEVKLDVSHLPAGFYFVRVQTATGWITEKWVKE